MSNNTCLVSPSCTWKPEWNGYFCPPSEESYVQIEVNDLTTSRTNRTDVNGVTWNYPYGTRVWFARFIELGNNSHTTTSVGHSMDCGTPCYQYLSDVTTRRAYAVRFGVNDHLQRMFYNVIL